MCVVGARCSLTHGVIGVIGETLWHFHILERISEGGMGVVNHSRETGA